MSGRALHSRPGGYAATIAARQDALRASRFGSRLLAHDDALWGDDPAHRKVAEANRRVGDIRQPRVQCHLSDSI